MSENGKILKKYINLYILNFDQCIVNLRKDMPHQSQVNYVHLLSIYNAILNNGCGHNPFKLEIRETVRLEAYNFELRKQSLLILFILNKIELNGIAAINYLISINTTIQEYCINFRDIQGNFKTGLIFRSSALVAIQDTTLFKLIFSKYSIKSIIDLRSKEETISQNYLNLECHYIQIPIRKFKSTSGPIERQHKLYISNILSSKDEICCFIKTISTNEGGILIHCDGGKKRTAIFVILLHLLVNSKRKHIIYDFLSSEFDCKPYFLNLVIKFIEESGGIYEFLLNCGVIWNDIKNIKYKTITYE